MVVSLYKIRTRKPKGNVRINFGHPLTRDLAFFYYETAGGTIYDAVTGKLASTNAAQTIISSTDYANGGNNLSFSGAGHSETTTAFTNPRAVNSLNLSIFARFKATAKPASKSSVLTYSDNSATRGIHVGISSGGFAGGGLFTSSGMVQVLDAVDHTNQWVNVSACSDGVAPSGVGITFVNGVKFSAAAAGTDTGVAVTKVCLGKDPTIYFQNFTGELSVAVGWNRIASDDEHRTMNANIWQMLMPELDFAFYSLPGTAAPPPSVSGATFKMMGVG